MKAPDAASDSKHPLASWKIAEFKPSLAQLPMTLLERIKTIIKDKLEPILKAPVKTAN